MQSWLVRASVMLAAAGWFGVSMAPVSCGSEECTGAGCQSGLVVRFGPSLNVDGDYVVEGTVDGEAFSCSTDSVSKSAPCNSQREIVVISDGAQLIQIAFRGSAPDRIQFVIRRDGMTLLETALEPQYQLQQPNGPSCPPTCKTAVVDVQPVSQ